MFLAGTALGVNEDSKLVQSKQYEMADDDPNNCRHHVAGTCSSVGTPVNHLVKEAQYQSTCLQLLHGIVL